MKKDEDSVFQDAKPKEKPYKIAAGESLYLLVTPAGGKYWRLSYRFDNKQKTLALGVLPTVSLREARKKRDEARQILANGSDPSAIRKQEKILKKQRSTDITTWLPGPDPILIATRFAPYSFTNSSKYIQEMIVHKVVSAWAGHKNDWGKARKRLDDINIQLESLKLIIIPYLQKSNREYYEKCGAWPDWSTVDFILSAQELGIYETHFSGVAAIIFSLQKNFSMALFYLREFEANQKSLFQEAAGRGNREKWFAQEVVKEAIADKYEEILNREGKQNRKLIARRIETWLKDPSNGLDPADLSRAMDQTSAGWLNKILDWLPPYHTTWHARRMRLEEADKSHIPPTD